MRAISAILLLYLLFLTGGCASGQDVYKTPSGKKYHLASCSTVKNVSEKISLEEAQALGLEPCKVCNPLATYSRTRSDKKPSGEGNTVQCNGKTKQGARCRHMTRIGNGYCFQHQPKKD